MLGQSHAENDQDRLAISCLERAVEMDPYSLDALLVSRPAISLHDATFTFHMQQCVFTTGLTKSTYWSFRGLPDRVS